MNSVTRYAIAKRFPSTLGQAVPGRFPGPSWGPSPFPFQPFHPALQGPSGAVPGHGWSPWGGGIGPGQAPGYPSPYAGGFMPALGPGQAYGSPSQMYRPFLGEAPLQDDPLPDQMTCPDDFPHYNAVTNKCYQRPKCPPKVSVWDFSRQQCVTKDPCKGNPLGNFQQVTSPGAPTLCGPTYQSSSVDPISTSSQPQDTTEVTADPSPSDPFPSGMKCPTGYPYYNKVSKKCYQIPKCPANVGIWDFSRQTCVQVNPCQDNPDGSYQQVTAPGEDTVCGPTSNATSADLIVDTAKKGFPVAHLKAVQPPQGMECKSPLIYFHPAKTAVGGFCSDQPVCPDDHPYYNLGDNSCYLTDQGYPPKIDGLTPKPAEAPPVAPNPSPSLPTGMECKSPTPYYIAKTTSGGFCSNIPDCPWDHPYYNPSDGKCYVSKHNTPASLTSPPTPKPAEAPPVAPNSYPFPSGMECKSPTTYYIPNVGKSGGRCSNIPDCPWDHPYYNPSDGKCYATDQHAPATVTATPTPTQGSSAALNPQPVPTSKAVQTPKGFVCDRDHPFFHPDSVSSNGGLCSNQPLCPDDHPFYDAKNKNCDVSQPDGFVAPVTAALSAAPAKSNTALWVGLGLAAAAGTGYYFYNKSQKKSSRARK